MIEGEYTGSMKEGVRDGVGKLEWSNGDVYEGQFKNGGIFVSARQAAAEFVIMTRTEARKRNIH